MNLGPTESIKKGKNQPVDKSLRRPSVSANTELRKSMVVGDGKHSKLETSIHRSELRKTFLGAKASQRSATMTQNDIKRQEERDECRNLKAGVCREVDASKHSSVRGGEQKKKSDPPQRSETKIGGGKDRKFLLHESLNDSTEIEQQQTVDLTGLSQSSESISSYERSGRNLGMDKPHSGNHSLFMKTAESKEEEQGGRQQSVSLNQKTQTPRD